MTPLGAVGTLLLLIFLHLAALLLWWRTRNGAWLYRVGCVDLVGVVMVGAFYHASPSAGFQDWLGMMLLLIMNLGIFTSFAFQRNTVVFGRLWGVLFWVGFTDSILVLDALGVFALAVR